MADICNRCGKMIVIPFNQQNEEKPNGRMVTLHINCDLDERERWEDAQREDELEDALL
ncbi:MAG: hypothetical protein ABH864_05255 [archaeon]